MLPPALPPLPLALVFRDKLADELGPLDKAAAELGFLDNSGAAELGFLDRPGPLIPMPIEPCRETLPGPMVALFWSVGGAGFGGSGTWGGGAVSTRAAAVTARESEGRGRPSVMGAPEGVSPCWRRVTPVKVVKASLASDAAMSCALPR